MGWGKFRSRAYCLVALTGTAASFTAPALAQTDLPEIRVIAPTPITGGGRTRPVTGGPRSATVPANTATTSSLTGDPTVIDRDKIPSNTQTLTAEDFTRTGSPNVTDTLFQRVPGITLSDPNGNSAQQEISYRGFKASPLQGTPQGIAVYMNGVRLNEAFGDTVNWDMIPSVAIDRADVWSSNPVFGLNALGGAINLQMKNGFIWQGLEVEGLGGSYGRASGTVQYGVRKDAWAFYLAAQGVHDDGWRQKSPATLGRFYADLGWRSEDAEMHWLVSAGQTSFGVAAATPIQLLNRNWTSIYTTPQTTRNDVVLLATNGKFALTDAWTLQSNLYYRGFRQRHVDGNDAEVERCSGNAANPLFNTLCLEDDGFPAQPKVNFQIRDQNNNPINCPPGPGNQCSITPYGTIDRTATDAQTVGASLQASSNEKVFGRDNHFTAGVSIDHSTVDFSASSELGYIFPDLSVGVNPAVPGTGSIIHTFGGLGYGPVDLAARSTYYGLYVTDTLDLTPRLSATAGGRLNIAKIAMADQLGTSPELNSNPTYSRINPTFGLTYKILPALTAYGSYSESNRAPTPLELGCASATKPCLIESFLVADPPLKQVIGKTYEAGLRGNGAAAGGKYEWKFGLFHTDTFNDILQLASTIAGRGFFQNVPQTRRQGIEAAAQYQTGSWTAYAGYSLIDATFQFTGDIASPNNPMADADGNVHVTPGKRIPGIPLHQFKVGADYLVTSQWKVGGDLVAVSSTFFTGDEANQNSKLPGYAVVNLHTTYQITKQVQLFGLVNNLFNNKYALFGTYFGPDGVQNVPLGVTLTDHRTEVPGQPLSIYVGLRAKL